MEGPTDKRFRSFLWSQTHKSHYLETRLTVPSGETAVTTLKPADPPEPVADPAPRSEGVAKIRPTRLDQAAMRLSEHCIGPASPAAEAAAPSADGLHVRRSTTGTQPLPNVPDRTYGRLNVTMSNEP